MSIRVACVQMDVSIGLPDRNIERVVDHIAGLACQNVDIAVFPEASLTGYCVSDREAAESIAISLDALTPIHEASERHDLILVVGFAERTETGVSNSAALFEPGQEPRFYRKTHLPHLGLDRFVEEGREIQVFDTRAGKIGVLICFDLRLPEPTRELALQGAELVVLPTNWPEGAEVSADSIAIARAAENRIFLATCDRVGTENGFRFIGKSKIIAPNGKVLASAEDGEETIIADIDLSEARTKRTVVVPGEYETEAIASRRPQLYRRLSE
jgi:predicted amidohydrolase